VDNLVNIGINVDLILGLKKQLAYIIETIELGMLQFFSSMNKFQIDDGIFVSPPKYVLNTLLNINMEDCKPCVAPYQSEMKLTRECYPLKSSVTIDQKLGGRIIYLNHSWNYISFVFTILSQFMKDP
jgi:hypothetical protein